jgi:hypothetical protein
MADQIVSWGGINSKGTSGMGITGSLSLIGDLNFQPSTSGASRYISMSASPTTASGNSIVIQAGDATASGTGGSVSIQPGGGAGGPGAGTVIISNTSWWNGATVNGLLTVTNQGPNTGTALTVNAGGGVAMKWDWDNINLVNTVSSATNKILRFTGATQYQVRGSGTTSSTTSFLVQDSNGSSAFEIKDDRSAFIYGPLTLARANNAFIYASATDYIALPRQGGAAPGYLSNSTVDDGWAITSPAGVYFRVRESGLGNPNGGITYQEYSGYNYGRSTFRIFYTGSFAATTLILKGTTPVAYSAGLNLLIAGGDSGDYNGVDARGAAGIVTIEGGSATSSSFTTHIAGAGVKIQTGLGLGSGSAADLTFSTSTTSSVASTYHTLSQRMIIKGQTGFVGIGTSTPSSSLHISGASAVLTLSPQDPLPSGVPTGSFAVSSSAPPKPYFYDGTTWNALY